MIRERGEGRRVETTMPKNYDRALAYRSRDPVIEKPAQMFRATRRRMGPEDDDVLEFAVLGALYSHREIMPEWSEPEARLISNGLSDEVDDMLGCESGLPTHPP
jgi:hypothetical protein